MDSWHNQRVQPYPCPERHVPTRGSKGRQLVLAVICTLVVAVALAACGSVPAGVGELRTLVVGAQPELVPIARELAETFARGRTGLQANVVGSADPAALLSRGEAEVALVTSSLTTMTPTVRAEIARQPIAVIVHASNKITALSRDDLALLLMGNLTDWSQLGADASPVMILSREPSPLRARVEAATLGPERRLSPNALLLPSDEAVAATVSRRPEAIGYITGVQAPTGTKIVAIDNALPTELARNRYYPLWQPVSVLTPAQPSPDAAAFVAYCSGRQGQRTLAAWGFGRGEDSR